MAEGDYSRPDVLKLCHMWYVIIKINSAAKQLKQAE